MPKTPLQQLLTHTSDTFLGSYDLSSQNITKADLVKIAAVLTRTNFPKRLSLTFSGNKIGDAGAKILLNVIKSRDFPNGLYLWLRDTGISRNILPWLISILPSNPCTRNVTLHFGKICSESEGIKFISNFLRSGKWPEGFDIDIDKTTYDRHDRFGGVEREKLVASALREGIYPKTLSLFIARAFSETLKRFLSGNPFYDFYSSRSALFSILLYFDYKNLEALSYDLRLLHNKLGSFKGVMFNFGVGLLDEVGSEMLFDWIKNNTACAQGLRLRFKSNELGMLAFQKLLALLASKSCPENLTVEYSLEMQVAEKYTQMKLENINRLIELARIGGIPKQFSLQMMDLYDNERRNQDVRMGKALRLGFFPKDFKWNGALPLSLELARARKKLQQDPSGPIQLGSVYLDYSDPKSLSEALHWLKPYRRFTLCFEETVDCVGANLLFEWLCSGDCPENFKLTLSCHEKTDPSYLDPFINFLKSGKIPKGLTLDLRYTEFNQSAFNKLCEILENPSFPKNRNFSIIRKNLYNVENNHPSKHYNWKRLFFAGLKADVDLCCTINSTRFCLSVEEKKKMWQLLKKNNRSLNVPKMVSIFYPRMKKIDWYLEALKYGAGTAKAYFYLGSSLRFLYSKRSFEVEYIKNGKSHFREMTQKDLYVEALQCDRHFGLAYFKVSLLMSPDETLKLKGSNKAMMPQALRAAAVGCRPQTTGTLSALTQFGFCLLGLKNVPVHHEKAFEYLTIAADGGARIAQTFLANFYYVTGDIKSSVKYYKRLAKTKDPHVAYQWGVFSEHGIGGTPCSIGAALKWYNKAICIFEEKEAAAKKRRNNTASYTLKEFPVDKAPYQLALEKLLLQHKRSLDTVSKVRLERLLDLLAQGALEKPYKVDLNLDAPDLFYRTGKLLIEGRLIEAEQSDPDKLVQSTRSSHDLYRDLPRGIKLLEKAVDLNHPEAACYLGLLAQTGFHQTKLNLKRSFFFFSKAALMGHTLSQLALSVLYETRQGIDPNMRRKEIAEEQSTLVELASKDPGLWAQAKQFSANGNPQACFLMGLIYEKGLGGVRKNFFRARDWYRHAQKNGLLSVDAKCAMLEQKTLAPLLGKQQRMHFSFKKGRSGYQLQIECLHKNPDDPNIRIIRDISFSSLQDQTSSCEFSLSEFPEVNALRQRFKKAFSKHNATGKAEGRLVLRLNPAGEPVLHIIGLPRDKYSYYFKTEGHLILEDISSDGGTIGILQAKGLKVIGALIGAKDVIIYSDLLDNHHGKIIAETGTVYIRGRALTGSTRVLNDHGLILAASGVQAVLWTLSNRAGEIRLQKLSEGNKSNVFKIKCFGDIDNTNGIIAMETNGIAYFQSKNLLNPGGKLAFSGKLEHFQCEEWQHTQAAEFIAAQAGTLFVKSFRATEHALVYLKMGSKFVCEGEVRLNHATMHSDEKFQIECQKLACINESRISSQKQIFVLARGREHVDQTSLIRSGWAMEPSLAVNEGKARIEIQAQQIDHESPLVAPQVKLKSGTDCILTAGVYAADSCRVSFGEGKFSYGVIKAKNRFCIHSRASTLYLNKPIKTNALFSALAPNIMISASIVADQGLRLKTKNTEDALAQKERSETGQIQTMAQTAEPIYLHSRHGTVDLNSQTMDLRNASVLGRPGSYVFGQEVFIQTSGRCLLSEVNGKNVNLQVPGRLAFSDLDAEKNLIIKRPNQDARFQKAFKSRAELVHLEGSTSGVTHPFTTHGTVVFKSTQTHESIPYTILLEESAEVQAKTVFYKGKGLQQKSGFVLAREDVLLEVEHLNLQGDHFAERDFKTKYPLKHYEVKKGAFNAKRLVHIDLAETNFLPEQSVWGDLSYQLHATANMPWSLKAHQYAGAYHYYLMRVNHRPNVHALNQKHQKQIPMLIKQGNRIWLYGLNQAFEPQLNLLTHNATEALYRDIPFQANKIILFSDHSKMTDLYAVIRKTGFHIQKQGSLSVCSKVQPIIVGAAEHKIFDLHALHGRVLLEAPSLKLPNIGLYGQKGATLKSVDTIEYGKLIGLKHALLSQAEILQYGKGALHQAEVEPAYCVTEGPATFCSTSGAIHFNSAQIELYGSKSDLHIDALQGSDWVGATGLVEGNAVLSGNTKIRLLTGTSARIAGPANYQGAHAQHTVASASFLAVTKPAYLKIKNTLHTDGLVEIYGSTLITQDARKNSHQTIDYKTVDCQEKYSYVHSYLVGHKKARKSRWHNSMVHKNRHLYPASFNHTDALVIEKKCFNMAGATWSSHLMISVEDFRYGEISNVQINIANPHSFVWDLDVYSINSRLHKKRNRHSPYVYKSILPIVFSKLPEMPVMILQSNKTLMNNVNHLRKAYPPHEESKFISFAVKREFGQPYLEGCDSEQATYEKVFEATQTYYALLLGDADLVEAERSLVRQTFNTNDFKIPILVYRTVFEFGEQILKPMILNPIKPKHVALLYNSLRADRLVIDCDLGKVSGNLVAQNTMLIRAKHVLFNRLQAKVVSEVMSQGKRGSTYKRVEQHISQQGSGNLVVLDGSLEAQIQHHGIFKGMTVSAKTANIFSNNKIQIESNIDTCLVESYAKTKSTTFYGSTQTREQQGFSVQQRSKPAIFEGDTLRLEGKHEISIRHAEFKQKKLYIKTHMLKLLSSQAKTRSSKSTHKLDLLWQQHSATSNETITHVFSRFLGDIYVDSDQILIQAVEGAPRAFMAHLKESKGKITYQTLENYYHHSSTTIQGPTPALATLVSIGVAIATQGMGSALGGALFSGSAAMSAAVSAGFSTLCSQSAVALLQNEGDPFKAIQSLSNSDTLKTLASSMITAGVMGKLSGTLNLPSTLDPKTFSDQATYFLIKAGVDAVANSAIQGEALDKALLKGLQSAAVQTVGAHICHTYIGAHYGSGKHLSYMQHKALHAIVGVASGAVLHGKQGAVSGALGAVASEMYTDFFAPEKPPVMRAAEALERQKGRRLTEAEFLGVYKIEMDKVQQTYRAQLSNVSNQAKLFAGTLALFFKQDVSTSVAMATQAVENNFMPSMWMGIGSERGAYELYKLRAEKEDVAVKELFERNQTRQNLYEHFQAYRRAGESWDATFGRAIKEFGVDKTLHKFDAYIGKNVERAATYLISAPERHLRDSAKYLGLPVGNEPRYTQQALNRLKGVVLDKITRDAKRLSPVLQKTANHYDISEDQIRFWQTFAELYLTLGGIRMIARGVGAPIRKGLNKLDTKLGLAEGVQGAGSKVINNVRNPEVFQAGFVKNKAASKHQNKPKSAISNQANSINAQAALDTKLKALQGAQKKAVKIQKLPDGRIRYYEAERRSRTYGPTRGSSHVTEYNPKTGQVRAWSECYDHHGNVNRINPKMIDGQQIHSHHYPPTQNELSSSKILKPGSPK